MEAQDHQDQLVRVDAQEMLAHRVPVDCQVPKV